MRMIILLRLTVIVIVTITCICGIIMMFSDRINDFKLFIDSYAGIIITLIGAAAFGSGISKVADGIKESLSTTKGAESEKNNDEKNNIGFDTK